MPLDNTYKDTLHFNSLSEQFAYFSGKVKRNFDFDDFSFQRLEKNIRVQCNPNDLYDCNYIMFQNENFGSKWFYAFIKAIHYKNENMSEIEFEIDVLQSWFFALNIKQSFVEREHVNNDSVGANTVPENLELGQMVTTATTQIFLNDLDYYIFCTEVLPVSGVTWNPPSFYGGTPIPCYWVKESLSEIKNIIDIAATEGKADAIISIFGFPRAFTMSETGGCTLSSFTTAPLTLNYIPKNNKLKVYPYVSLNLLGVGSAVTLKYEYLTSPNIYGLCALSPNPTAIFYPVGYADNTANISEYEYSVTVTGFPVLAWVSNYYQNWIARNGASLLANSLMGAVGTAAQITSGNVAGAAGTALGAITSQLSQIYEAQIVPDTLKGSIGGANALIGNNRLVVQTQCKAITAEYAKIIDDFFSMYGYKVNKVKIPNITGRRSWNYVKTLNAVITGNAPVDDIQKIRSIFDAGITFWHGDYVGDYSRDNSII